MIYGLKATQMMEITAVILSLIGSFFILRNNFKRYGLLYFISGLTGAFLCFVFVSIGFYSFPARLIPMSPIPIIEMFTVIPFYVLFGVRYSPSKWGWKIPFYWGMVHIAMLLEIFVLFPPVKIMDYKENWDAWDSYTWWWIYLLLFEWIGGKIVPTHSRKPIQSKSFRYGRWGWVVFHFIVITTIFLAGVYTGWNLKM
ncbi:CBO0543 family protein [Parageobacillus sp. G301]|jgi:hypothetical protein|uniref:CBO0543 family protein n=1 Tax=Anoxybacillaceae TaxID=3120669 RepID=UPI002497EA4E|nr:CBO0543 family protein [Parageobacillus sp. G301]GLH65419.1 hypothetical protein PG301_32580 [Parageobacillus sp. G301]